MFFSGCALRVSLRVLSAICGRPTISGVRTLGSASLCTVVTCRVSLRSRRDGDTAGRRSGAGATGETAGRLPPSDDADDTAGAVGVCTLVVVDGGCTAACSTGCTAVCGVGCPDIDAAVCGCCTTGVTRREPTSALGICLACCAACCTGGAGGIMRLGGDTAEPAETAGAVLLGWAADAVCPCAAVAAATAAAGTMPDECPADSVGDTGGCSGSFCSVYPVYPVRTSDRLLSLYITVCAGGDTGMTGVTRAGRDAVGCPDGRGLRVSDAASCDMPGAVVLSGVTCSGVRGMAAAGCTGVTDSPGAVSTRCVGMTGVRTVLSVCGTPIRPKSAGSGGTAGDTGEMCIRLTAFASEMF